MEKKMLKPQPRHKQTPPPPSNEPRPQPEITQLLDRDVIGKLYDGAAREYLAAMIASPVFRNFCEEQLASAQKRANELQVGHYSAEEYYQLSKDFRLLWRFWNDFVVYATDLKNELSTKLGE
jgi:hypothetical protein